MHFLLRYFPWLMAALWLVVRLIAGKLVYPGLYESGRTVGVMTNLLLILAVIFVSLIYAHVLRTEQRSSYGGDIKTCLKASLKYALGVALCMWLYYGLLSNELQLQREHDFEQITLALDTPKEVEQAIAGNPMLKSLSGEAIAEAMRKRVTFFTDIKVIAPSALLMLTLVSVLYALLAVFMWRQFIKQR